MESWLACAWINLFLLLDEIVIRCGGFESCDGVIKSIIVRLASLLERHYRMTL